MAKGSEPDVSLTTKKTGTGARLHCRRSSESCSYRWSAHPQPIHDDNPKQNLKVWDCESNLYDSFELLAFLRQLNGALPDACKHSAPPQFRSSSMPHHLGFGRVAMDDDRDPEVEAGGPDSQNVEKPLEQKRGTKFPWSVGKLMRGLFKRSGGRSKL